MSCARAPIILLLVTAVLSTPVSAQYFGRNKVQYRTFEFRVLKTEHFDVYHYPEEARGIEIVGRMAERWRARLGRVLKHELTGRQPLVMYASSTDFQQTNVIGGEIGEGTGGVTEGLRRRIVMPFAGPLADTDHVLGHELVHAYQYDISTQLARGAGRERIGGVERLPLWFIEGMAEYLSIGSRSPLTAMWMRDALSQEELPRIEDLDSPEYFPYRWGHAFWAYVAGRWGDEVIAPMLRSAIRSGDTANAFKGVLGVDEKQLSADWHAALHGAFDRLTATATAPDQAGRALTPEEGPGGSVNVSPALSPDGRQIAYLSSRGLFSIDLYVADTATGRVTARLTSTDIDPHYNSLQFISSAGTWDPGGTRLAVTAIADGRPVLAIYDVAAERRTREIVLPGLEGALNPAWSPDGARIALVGMQGGLTDLYTIELDSGRLERLTDDPYAELQPSWSPDGARLAFATDRFGSSLASLDLTPLRLGVITRATKAIAPLGPTVEGRQVAPEWTRDGEVYFVADAGGVSNLYRLASDLSRVEQLTDLATGATGITESSPALSAAGGRVAFSVFDQGDYRLFVIDDPAPIARASADATDAAQLPPAERASSLLADVLASEAIGLPPPSATPQVVPYRPRLQLDYVGQPTIGVGVDRFGTYGGGGMSFHYSDMLGDHTLGAAVQVNSTLNSDFSVTDLGGALMYVNQRRRWNWGVSLDQTPYRTGYLVSSAAVIDGIPVGIDQAIIQRETDRGVTGLLSYPFSRAQRVEVQAGFRNLDFRIDQQTQIYSLETGQLLSDERETLSTFPSLNLGVASAALVYDTSVFGVTSPVRGQRYRFEVSPTFGSLAYTGVLADYRRYFMPAQLYTVAARVMHYGRYGAGSEDDRLIPLFVGYPSLVRGYDVGTFGAEECAAPSDRGCEVIDRLVGTRMAVANLELRFPLLRPFGLGQGGYGILPVEAALFADAGLAWSSGQKPTFLGGNRRAVSSVGAALRVNALGFAVLQFDMSRPLQREDRGWVFQFTLAPGF
jgi:Tol biopolymer transport system component